ncbi:MAG: histidine kinase [Alphaproteobacteria bacterium]|nr:histidine kinase [Alphaproteobacteria bacterium]
MDAERTGHPEVFRQAVKLTLGVWFFTFILFLMPIVVSTGHVPRFYVGVTLLCIAFGILMSWPLYWVAARLHDRAAPLKIAGTFAAVCFSALLFSAFDAVNGGEIIKLFMSAHRIPPDFVNRTVSNFISFSWLYGLLGTIYVILHTHAAMRDRELQLAEARSLAQTAQLTALRLQLNPHFLFNTLNAISSLIVTGRARQGEAMLGKLCDFLRTALTAETNGANSVGEELETLQTYLEIEAIRFGDRLTVEFAAAEAVVDLPVPSFILQPLVENAVKYAVAPTSEPVIVRVGARRDGCELVLSVSDNGRTAAAAAAGKPSGTGVGLENTRRRLDVLYGRKARLETIAYDDGFTAVIRLPVVERPALGIVAAA